MIVELKRGSRNRELCRRSYDMLKRLQGPLVRGEL